jgi:hypothetical protein
MKLVKATGNLHADFKNVIKEWKNIIAAGEHLGKAQSLSIVPSVTPQQIGLVIALLCRKFF